MTATLGVLMLETRFPRLLGDIGNPATFAFPVRYRTVRGASPRRVVVERDRALLAAVHRRRARRSRPTASTRSRPSCGFLALFQRELAAAVAVPMWTSSLLLVAELEAEFGQAARASASSPPTRRR